MDYKINNDRVLIVPGFTDEEILRKSDKNNKEEIPQPTSLFFECNNVQYTPHIKSYEEFNSAEGLILMEKACDKFAEVEMDILVHQQISNTKGNILIDKDSREARLRVNDTSVVEDNDNPDQLYVSRWVKPEEFTEEFLQIRDAFFEDLYGRPLTIVSPLFPPMPVAYLTDAQYNIDSGAEEASYSVTFREVESLGI